ncbi:phosphonate metabolism protein PhnP [Photobacterium sanctipauli]|uniref:Phosphonate metabolism protein PhnP n=1 Tax=Photobacterium sanctipauli TaxID=1342794 RepID=A0A2T3NMX1_9GAMM|nr:phosphonate metabolism protein PhnP [Photobacterium sanctipauli]PSW16864.1 phosphonate metabolism protein PhnP [Photobacterium sanctipauli]
MKLTAIGTGNARHLPVYGCHCQACERARLKPEYRRSKTSAVLSHNNKQLLIDANADDLMTRFPAGDIDRILLTHYHMDHVQALFDLRWGLNMTIPVDGPDDPNGCDDLFKHPGILDFQPPKVAFDPFQWQGITITPLPMLHSKPCFGYCFELGERSIAYLTDTADLPLVVKEWLVANPVDLMLIDCSFPPVDRDNGEQPQNHNDVVLAKQLKEECRVAQMGLIHIGHNLESWAMDNPDHFDDSFFLAADGQEFS